MAHPDSNRFTIADYTYDRDDQQQAESSTAAIARAAYTDLAPKEEYATSSGIQSALSPLATAYRPKAQRQPTDGVPVPASSSGLKLHDYPPTSPPSHLFPPSSPSMPTLSPAQSYSSTHALNTNHPTSELSHGISVDMDEERDIEGDRRSVISDMSEKHHHTGGFDEPKTAAPGLSRMGSKRNQNIWQKMVPSTRLTQMLLGTILFETVINLAIEGNILYRFKEEVESTTSTDLEWENRRRLPIYLIIFGLAHLWQIVLTVIAIRTKNTIQVMSVTAFNFAFLGYAIIQIYELRKILGDNLAQELTGDEDSGTTLMTIPLNVLTALIIAIVGVSCLILTALSYYLQREFGWQRYRFLGADLMIREYYTKLQVFECICYFSAFFCAGFGIQFIWLVLNPEDVEYIITWVAFPLLLVFLVIGRFAAKYENKYMMAAFMVGLVAGMAYFIYKLARIWQQSSTTYRTLAKSLTTFDALSLASLLACAVWGVMVWLNFGKGLKQALLARPGTISSVVGMWRSKSAETQEKGQEMVMAERRVSID
ncbi:uncharacterized protein I303_103037 [Kwoniella dejecticola CBS 10117]|uniref:Uncharacterized protein n=1 Tax=Kwoniella dejecticola CBS 10117 TaxID=1296121 RepID=A0A1A6AAG0_9TREE|nr:uncharacterized protein I303_03057 [Kwoniella dejecticola CBS 10117]OBR87035.1 hypothetical protein I303_03057 [Kwoniella dejecticola CBS 10117]